MIVREITAEIGAPITLRGTERDAFLLGLKASGSEFRSAGLGAWLATGGAGSFHLSPERDVEPLPWQHGWTDDSADGVLTEAAVLYHLLRESCVTASSTAQIITRSIVNPSEFEAREVVDDLPY